MEAGNGRTHQMPSNIHSDYEGIDSQGLLELVLPFILQLLLNQKISKRWSDEGSATTGSSRRVEKIVRVLLLRGAAGNHRVGILLAASRAV